MDDRTAIEATLAKVEVLLNCAGPYLRTARPLTEAAIRVGTHYLDIAAELDSYRLTGTLDEAATAARVMLLPGSSGSVAMLGCLAAYTAARVERPLRLRIALHVAGSMSRGSAISASEDLTTETLHRVDGHLAHADSTALRQCDFEFGDVACMPVTLPDLITIGRASGIVNVNTYVHTSGDVFPVGALADLPDGPSAEQRAADRYHAVAEVTGCDGGGFSCRAPGAGRRGAPRLPYPRRGVRRRVRRDHRRHPHRRPLTTPEQERAFEQEMVTRVPLGRIGRPEEMAKAALSWLPTTPASSPASISSPMAA